MNTRSYRLSRIALEQELGESVRRAQLNVLLGEVNRRERWAAGLPVIDSSDLATAFRVDRDDAARQLAALTPQELARQAVAHAAYLTERYGRPFHSADVFANFTVGIARLSK